MSTLHLTKVAVGCASLDLLAERLAGRAEGGAAPVWTRYRPTRHAELVGGSLFWIIKHRLVARQPILGFEESEEKRCIIRVGMPLVPVRARPLRAHQGWRYLAGDAAPPDLSGWDADDLAAMPAALVATLAELALI